MSEKTNHFLLTCSFFFSMPFSCLDIKNLSKLNKSLTADFCCFEETGEKNAVYCIIFLVCMPYLNLIKKRPKSINYQPKKVFLFYVNTKFFPFFFSFLGRSFWIMWRLINWCFWGLSFWEFYRSSMVPQGQLKSLRNPRTPPTRNPLNSKNISMMLKIHNI